VYEQPAFGILHRIFTLSVWSRHCDIFSDHRQAQNLLSTEFFAPEAVAKRYKLPNNVDIIVIT